jgi:hypothetical protein
VETILKQYKRLNFREEWRVEKEAIKGVHV